jgi:hypothetical protein
MFREDHFCCKGGTGGFRRNGWLYQRNSDAQKILKIRVIFFRLWRHLSCMSVHSLFRSSIRKWELITGIIIRKLRNLYRIFNRLIMDLIIENLTQRARFSMIK